MSWEAIGAIGDIGGAVAVIATLFFLYKQIRLNTRELERANLHQSAQSTMSNNALYVQIWQPLMQDKELADILYCNCRNYRIVETCHNISFNPDFELLGLPERIVLSAGDFWSFRTDVVGQANKRGVSF